MGTEPEVIVLAWKTPSVSKPSAIVILYQGFDVEEAEKIIAAAIAKGTVDSARVFRGFRGNYLPLPMYCADRPVPASASS